MTFISYAQNLEDVMLWRALGHVDNGFYIDIGAWDPREDSVTLAFYERGWRGINVEPDVAKYRALSAARPGDVTLCVALADVAGEATFHVIAGTGLSTLDPGLAARHAAAGFAVAPRAVAVDTLRAVCAAHVRGPIHFLKVDVEGMEAAVLAGADWTRDRPWIVVVEAAAPYVSTTSRPTWEPMLQAAGYRPAYHDGLNWFYLADEQAIALAPAFVHPPNVSDDYVSVAGLCRGLGLPQAQQTPAMQEALRDAFYAAGQVAREPDAGPVLPDQTRLYYDATLILQFGLETPVGIVRTEHYVAEFLHHDPAIDLRFLLYDPALRGYRTPMREEAALLARILFERYGESAARPDLQWVEAPQPLPPKRTVEPLQAYPRGDAEPPAPPLGGNALTRKLRTATRLSPEDFQTMTERYAVQYMPVRPHHSLPRRLATHAARRTALRSAASLRTAVHRLAVAAASAADRGRRLALPDEPPTAPDVDLPGQSVVETPAPIPAPFILAEPDPPLPEHPPGTFHFASGDVLLAMGNLWDYLDYAYLHRLVRVDGVRFVSVIFDVIAMQYPYTTPNPAHVYQRHWVELAHSAAHLLAISRFSADEYSARIAEPNDLSPPISHAYLPSVLAARADDIGEVAVPALLDRRFVVYCSTIETRKNHVLLLHLWDRLRLEYGPDRLPVLVFAGKWGWGTETVRLMAERHPGLRPHLLVLNRTSDAELIWLYRHARFTVFPALSEGYGLAAAESLSFGTPVIVADCPALVEATEGLMPAHDPLDFVSWMAEMRRLIEDDERLDALRAAAGSYRGPSYLAFAEAVRTIVQTLSDEHAPCPAA